MSGVGLLGIYGLGVLRVLLFCSGNAGGERERGRFSIVLMQVIHVILALLATKAGVAG